jgi:hypothetical protein
LATTGPSEVIRGWIHAGIPRLLVERVTALYRIGGVCWPPVMRYGPSRCWSKRWQRRHEASRVPWTEQSLILNLALWRLPRHFPRRWAETVTSLFQRHDPDSDCILCQGECRQCSYSGRIRALVNGLLIRSKPPSA